MANRLQVAPRELIVRDFHDLDLVTRLGATWEMERALLQVAVTSHAHGGHGAFRGRRFVDTTEDHVARAMGLNAEAERARRQRWIDEIFDWTREAIAGRAPHFAVNPDGQPLFGIGLFRWLMVEPREVLRGLVLGGHRDAPEWRRRAQARYGVRIGYGKAHPVNLERMAAAGLTGETLARQGHEQQLDALRAEGILLPDDTLLGGPVQAMYVRYQEGPGASDDAAILFAGRLHGPSAALGCCLADAMDTMEKYTAHPTDADEDLARLIEREAPALAPSEDDVVRLTFLASTPPDLVNILPDSTMRHFLQVDDAVNQSVLESHFLWLTGRPWAPMRTGHAPRMDTDELYRYVEQRLDQEGLDGR